MIAHTSRGPVHFRSELRGDRHYVEVKLPETVKTELLLPPSGEAAFPPLSPDHPSGLKRYRLPPGVRSFDVPRASDTETERENDASK